MEKIYAIKPCKKNLSNLRFQIHIPTDYQISNFVS